MLLAMLMGDYITFMTSSVCRPTSWIRSSTLVPYYPTADIQKTIEASKGLVDGLKKCFGSKPEQQITINEADLAKAKDELRNRVQAVLGGLMQCGIQGTTFGHTGAY